MDTNSGGGCASCLQLPCRALHALNFATGGCVALDYGVISSSTHPKHASAHTHQYQQTHRARLPSPTHCSYVTLPLSLHTKQELPPQLQRTVCTTVGSSLSAAQQQLGEQRARLHNLAQLTHLS
eukprot:1159846-Pelagomonas_calceolata.AAC.17